MLRAADSACTARFLRALSRRRPVASRLTPGNSSPEGVSYGCTAPSSRFRSSLAASSGNAASRFATGPASAEVRDHQSSNESARSGVESSSTTTSSKSASCNRRVTRSASSSANGPGTPGGGTGAPSWALTASSKTLSHGLRSRGPHTTAARRPPGRSTRRISRSACAGSSANMRPSRQSTTS